MKIFEGEGGSYCSNTVELYVNVGEGFLDAKSPLFSSSFVQDCSFPLVGRGRGKGGGGGRPRPSMFCNRKMFHCPCYYDM